jgi:GH25 family lysozyme M1 (1,4-beta-N-acetylmuramidase)
MKHKIIKNIEVDNMSIHGIDVSEFLGGINWADVKGSGTQFVMIRAGYGQGNLDPEFRRNAEECNRQGIPSALTLKTHR